METFKILVIDQNGERLRWVRDELESIFSINVCVEVREALWEGDPFFFFPKQKFNPDGVICRPQFGSFFEELSFHGSSAGGTAGISNCLIKRCDFTQYPMAWLAAPEDRQNPRFAALRSWSSNLGFDILGDDPTAAMGQSALVRLCLIRLLQMHLKQQQHAAKCRQWNVPTSKILLRTALWEQWLQRLARNDQQLMCSDPVAEAFSRIITDSNALFEGILK